MNKLYINREKVYFDTIEFTKNYHVTPDRK